MLTPPSSFDTVETPHHPTKADPFVPPDVQTLYTSALTHLLHRQPRLAISQCHKAFQLVQRPSEIHNSFWVIYVTALSKDLKGGVDEAERVTESWEYVVNGYGGVPGDVEAKVVVACILLCLDRNLLDQARSIAESWISTLSEETVVFLEQRRHDDDEKIRTGYERVVELYLLHVLARIEDWEGANEFLKWNEMLTEEKKTNYQTYIDRLCRKSHRLRSVPSPVPSPPSFQENLDTEDRIKTIPRPSTTTTTISQIDSLPETISSKAPITTKQPPTSASPSHTKESTSLDIRLRKFLPTLIGPRLAFLIVTLLFLMFISRRNDRLRHILMGTWMKIVGTVKMGTSLSTL